MAREVSLPQLAWYGDNWLKIEFPERWEVDLCKMAGHDTRPLDDGQIWRSFLNPIECETISSLAQGKKRAVIMFDDLNRPTPISKLVTFVLSELRKGGIKDSSVSFMAATGCHRPMVRQDFVKKLGETTVETYPVYTHNPFGTMSCIESLGHTSRGTPVEVNREIMEADLRIGIGGIYSHSIAGFGGGAKIILPGCSSVDSIRYNHEELAGGKPGNFRPHPSTGSGKVEANIARLDMEEAGRIAGLHVKVDAVINNRRKIVGVFVGDFVREHRKGVELAKRTYATRMIREADIVLSNSYPHCENPGSALWVADDSLKEGGDLVIVASSPEGIFLNYIASKFLTKQISIAPYSPAKKARRIFILSKYLSQKDIMTPPFEKPRVIWCKTWAKILKELQEVHGKRARVAVYPYAGLQTRAHD